MSKFIRDWQAKHGLKDDGIIGKNTLIAMHNVLCIPSLEATCHFVGNTYHETGGYTVFEENLNYSAEGLVKTWPSRFTLQSAKEYARKPEKIANKVYSNRMGNGDEASGDGWKFRGRGSLQTTGKNNYKLFGEYLRVDLLSNPDLVSTTYQLESAIFYFESNKLWNMCSTITDESIKKVRRAVNGGQIGIDSVMKLVYKYKNILKI